jgi:hypothetical protein
MREKHNEALLLLPRLFSEAGYEVTITDPPYPNYSYKDDLRIYNEYPGIKAYITDGVYSDVWLKAHNVHIPSRSDILTRDIFWYSVLKTAPLAFREAIYGQGLWLSPVHIARMITSINAYSVLDYLPRLSDCTDGKENTFLFLVNNTTHENNFYQAPEYRPALSVTKYAPGRFKSIAEYYSNAASLMRLGDWFIRLKTEGVYDNTRVIIAADHGTQQNYVPVGKLPFSHNGLNPLLLVKDFNARGALVSDGAFMTNADVPYLALHGQIDGARNPWTGKPISIEDKERPVYIARSAGVHRGDPRAGTLLFNAKEDYYVHGDIFDEKNWTRASDF